MERGPPTLSGACVAGHYCVDGSMTNTSGVCRARRETRAAVLPTCSGTAPPRSERLVCSLAFRSFGEVQP
eukprot:5882276-Prymnesium_polylepis.1